MKLAEEFFQRANPTPRMWFNGEAVMLKSKGGYDYIGFKVIDQDIDNQNIMITISHPEIPLSITCHRDMLRTDIGPVHLDKTKYDFLDPINKNKIVYAIKNDFIAVGKVEQSVFTDRNTGLQYFIPNDAIKLTLEDRTEPGDKVIVRWLTRDYGIEKVVALADNGLPYVSCGCYPSTGHYHSVYLIEKARKDSPPIFNPSTPNSTLTPGPTVNKSLDPSSQTISPPSPLVIEDKIDESPEKETGPESLLSTFKLEHAKMLDEQHEQYLMLEHFFSLFSDKKYQDLTTFFLGDKKKELRKLVMSEKYLLSLIEDMNPIEQLRICLILDIDALYVSVDKKTADFFENIDIDISYILTKTWSKYMLGILLGLPKEIMNCKEDYKYSDVDTGNCKYLKYILMRSGNYKGDTISLNKMNARIADMLYKECDFTLLS